MTTQSGAAATTHKNQYFNARSFIQDKLPTWTDQSPTRMRDIASALSCLARAADVPLDNILLTQPTVAALITKAERDCKPIRPNDRTKIKYILTRLSGQVWDPGRNHCPLSEPWQLLFDQIPAAEKFAKCGVSRFLQFCSRTGVDPDTLSAATLPAFERYLAEELHEVAPARVGRSTVAGWRRLQLTSPGWPAANLCRPEKARTVTRPLTDFPESFQAAVRDFQRHITYDGFDAAGSSRILDPYTALAIPADQRRRRPPKPVRPATLNARTYQILQAAGALLASGVPIESILNLQCLVQPVENARNIALHFWTRCGSKPNGNAANVLTLLFQIAKFHSSLTPDEIVEVGSYRNRLRPKQGSTMTRKNAMRLQQMVSASNRPVVLHISNALMDRAKKCKSKEHAAALALYATAIEILLICPLRLKNLRELKLGQSITGVSAKQKGDAYLNLEEDDTKNEHAMHWKIPAESVGLIRTYVAKFRPAIAPAGNDFLFPGRGLSPRSDSGMRGAVCKSLGDLGIKINPHIFRHFAVWLYLKHNPGAYEEVRRVLGHKNLETTIKFYAGLEAQFAFEKHDRIVFDARRETRSTAKVALERPSRLRGRPGGVR